MVDTASLPSLPARLGKNLAAARKARGLTQATVAERMDMETESISRFERGATLPSLATLEELAALLDTTMAELLAEYPQDVYPEAQRITARLATLAPENRAEVADLVDRVCRMLAKSAG